MGKSRKTYALALFGRNPDPVLYGAGYAVRGCWPELVADLQTFCESQVSDEDFAKAESLYPINPPQSKEDVLITPF